MSECVVCQTAVPDQMVLKCAVRVDAKTSGGSDILVKAPHVFICGICFGVILTRLCPEEIH